MPVAVTCGKTHFAVYVLGIFAQGALDDAHRLDELAPIGRIQEPEAGNAVADGNLVGGLSLVRRGSLRQAVADGVAIAVAAVPEGLPLVATLALLLALALAGLPTLIVPRGRSLSDRLAGARTLVAVR